MTVQDDTKKIMKKYRFVTAKNRADVVDLVSACITNWDSVTLLVFEFDALQCQEFVNDLLLTVKSYDDLLEINSSFVDTFRLVLKKIEERGMGRGVPPECKGLVLGLVEKYFDLESHVWKIRKK
jgi:hypothetical protein